MTYPVTITRAEAQLPALPWSSFWSNRDAQGDWRVAPSGDAVNPGGLSADDPLESAVIISLFTDRLAPEGWRPDVVDRRGWWGDAAAPEGEQPEAIGSHLWLLRNEKATQSIAALARLYAEEALAWMLRDKVAGRVTVETGLIDNPRRGVSIGVTIFGRDGAQVYDRRFQRFWDAL